MNLIFALILLLIILYIYIIQESFEPVSSNQYSTWEQGYKSDNDNSKPTFYSQLDYKKVPEINCCIVEKKYLPNPDELYEGEFKYTFSKKSDEQCNITNYNLNSNTEILIEGDNGWSNDFCLTGIKKIGSCRNINKECIDFVDKDFCDKYRMTWSNKTCHQPLEFTWIDPVKIELPAKQQNGGIFKMF